MALNNLHISQIIKEGRASLSKDKHGEFCVKSKWKKIILFDILPIIFLFFPILGFRISSDVKFLDYSLTFISIFAGLLFSLIVILSDKGREKKAYLIKNKTSINESLANELKRYIKYVDSTIPQISYTIIISIQILLISLVLQVQTPSFIFEFMNSVELWNVCHYLVQGAIFFLGIRFIIMTLVVVSNMFAFMVLDIRKD